MKLWKSRKGIAPAVMTLLLIGIAMSGAVIFGGWLMSWIPDIQKKSQIRMMVEDVLFCTEPDAVRLTIRNTGSIPVVVETICISYSDDAQINTLTLTENNVIASKESKTFTFLFPESQPWQASKAYKVKAVVEGGVFVEHIQYAPNY